MRSSPVVLTESEFDEDSQNPIRSNEDHSKYCDYPYIKD